ncbi:MarR family winged helix-turn-helix transcriptional regulator [Luteipulveratus halotolerans]|uniref:MarR family winged helix-turn-helix transcriptional regulator n=1 Tax=Luteipulveratus halotolerans TaxID=1631356 RepID=UPI000680E4B5|nr:MarR family transcriptional regulator [Luteipulveratus halotolerans]
MPQSASRRPAVPDELFYNVFLIEQQVGAVLSQALQGTGITPSEFAIYSALAMHREPVKPSDLADELSLPRSTLTGYLGTLERRAHLSRVPNPADGRSSYVALTPAGAEAHRGAARSAMAAQARLDERLGSDLTGVRAALVTLYSHLDAALADPSTV